MKLLLKLKIEDFEVKMISLSHICPPNQLCVLHFPSLSPHSYSYFYRTFSVLPPIHPLPPMFLLSFSIFLCNAPFTLPCQSYANLNPISNMSPLPFIRFPGWQFENNHGSYDKNRCRILSTNCSDIDVRIESKEGTYVRTKHTAHRDCEMKC